MLNKDYQILEEIHQNARLRQDMSNFIAECRADLLDGRIEKRKAMDKKEDGPGAICGAIIGALFGAAVVAILVPNHYEDRIRAIQSAAVTSGNAHWESDPADGHQVLSWDMREKAK